MIGILTALSALGGGFFSHLFSSSQLKLIFAIMLVFAGFIMLVHFPENRKTEKTNHRGIIIIKSQGITYRINPWIALPVTLITGFSSGMVGVSGGSFLVSLMVFSCGVSMRTAIGTSSILIALTAFMGFTGHAFQGDFNPSWAVPLAFITILGGIIGGKFALKSKPKNLKRLFAYTNLLAAAFMIINVIHNH